MGFLDKLFQKPPEKKSPDKIDKKTEYPEYYNKGYKITAVSEEGVAKDTPQVPEGVPLKEWPGDKSSNIAEEKIPNKPGETISEQGRPKEITEEGILKDKREE